MEKRERAVIPPEGGREVEMLRVGGGYCWGGHLAGWN